MDKAEFHLIGISLDRKKNETNLTSGVPKADEIQQA